MFHLPLLRSHFFPIYRPLTHPGGRKKIPFPPPFLIKRKRRAFLPSPVSFPPLSPSLSLLLPQKEGERKGKEELSRQQLGRKGEGKKRSASQLPPLILPPDPVARPVLGTGGGREGGRRGYMQRRQQESSSFLLLFLPGEEELAQCVRRWSWREKNVLLQDSGSPTW